jgi:hypothetical protein
MLAREISHLTGLRLVSDADRLLASLIRVKVRPRAATVARLLNRGGVDVVGYDAPC